MEARPCGLAILVVLVLGLGLGIATNLSPIGGVGVQAPLFFFAAWLGIGCLLGSRFPAIRSVMGLGTGQRNVSTAIVAAVHRDGSHPVAVSRRLENVRRI